jgi:hypothetical protein
MEQHKRDKALLTIFYSNYSPNSKALLQFIKNTNLMDKLSIRFINIDNTTIKNIILKKFTVVPSMVVIMNDEISLYSGNNVFEWFNIFMSSSSSESANSLDPSGLRTPIGAKTETEASEAEASKKVAKTIMEIAAEISKARES